jgi:hypothetical protein
MRRTKYPAKLPWTDVNIINKIDRIHEDSEFSDFYDFVQDKNNENVKIALENSKVAFIPSNSALKNIFDQSIVKRDDRKSMQTLLMFNMIKNHVYDYKIDNYQTMAENKTEKEFMYIDTRSLYEKKKLLIGNPYHYSLRFRVCVDEKEDRMSENTEFVSINKSLLIKNMYFLRDTIMIPPSLMKCEFVLKGKKWCNEAYPCNGKERKNQCTHVIIGTNKQCRNYPCALSDKFCYIHTTNIFKKGLKALKKTFA